LELTVLDKIETSSSLGTRRWRFFAPILIALSGAVSSCEASRRVAIVVAILNGVNMTPANWSPLSCHDRGHAVSVARVGLRVAFRPAAGSTSYVSDLKKSPDSEDDFVPSATGIYYPMGDHSPPSM
jgi:hypothetical protein